MELRVYALAIVALCASIFLAATSSASSSAVLNRGGVTVPDQPNSVSLSVLGSTKLKVDWTQPVNDGGSQVTSYKVEWDSHPGVREIQTIRTQTYIGANEVQTITTTATHRDEVQIIRTTADDVDEVQLIKTVAVTGEKIGGYFTLRFDTTAHGGSIEESAPILFNAGAQVGDGSTRTSMQEILNGMQNIGLCAVTRVGPDSENGYEWRITFSSATNEGNVPELTLAYSGLTGTGADVKISTLTHGNNIAGSFTLMFGGAETAPIAFDALDGELQASLEALPTVGELAVTRSGPDAQTGYVWAVTFMSDFNTGDVPAIAGNKAGLTPVKPGSAYLTVCTDGNSVGVCDGSSVKGNELGGSFDLDFGGNIASGISYDASPTEMKTKLQALTGINLITVTRGIAFKQDNMGRLVSSDDGPDPQLGYSWVISFTETEGDVPALTVANDGALSGDGKLVKITETRKGSQKEIQELTAASATSQIGGSLTLTVDGHTTQPIAVVPDRCSDNAFTNKNDCENNLKTWSTASDCDLTKADIEAKVEALSNVGLVTVTCTTTGVTNGFKWRVTFDTNPGNLATMTIGKTALTPADAAAGTSISAEIDGTSAVLSGRYSVEFMGQRTGYLPYNVDANALKAALEGLSTVGTVEVVRSDPDESMGYTWTVTFTSDLGNEHTTIGNLPAMIVDGQALHGTVPQISVAEVRPGEFPPFNQGPADLALGSATVTDLDSLTYTVTGLKQGVQYFVRVAATNDVGFGKTKIAAPPFAYPMVIPPSTPTDVALAVVDGSSINVRFATPLNDGGSPVDRYLVEWHEEALLDEIQSISCVAPVINEVQTITTSTDATAGEDEIQTVHLTGDFNPSIGAFDEVQTLTCDANSGTFSMSFRGAVTQQIPWDATAADLKTAIESLGTHVVNQVTVNIGGNGAQTTICRPFVASPGGDIYPENVTIQFNDVPGYAGDVPLMTTDVTKLGGGKRADVIESTKGMAAVGGSFKLQFRSYTTDSISYGATNTAFRDELMKLNSIPTGGITVSVSAANAAGGYVWSVTFTDPIVGGDIEGLVAHPSGLVGNGVTLTVCTNGQTDGVCAGNSRAGNSLGGFFALEMLGHRTDDIVFNAAASTIKQRLEALPNIGTVEVTRTGPTAELAYVWTVTFTSNPGSSPTGSQDVDALIAYRKDPNERTILTGQNSQITVGEQQKGSHPLSGTFTISYDFTGTDEHTTKAIRNDISAAGMKQALEELPNIGRVEVSRTLISDGYMWKVTFSGCRTVSTSATADGPANICNFGNIPSMYAKDISLLVGGNAGVARSVLVDTIRNGTGGSQDSRYRSAVVTDLSGEMPHTYTIQDLVYNTPYYVRVTGRNNCPDTCPGCCAYGIRQTSLPLYATPINQKPGSPPAPHLVSSTAHSVKVKWEHPTTNGGSPITGYKLWMNDWAGGGYRMVFDGTGHEEIKSFDTGSKVGGASLGGTMMPGQKYRFKVQALNDIGASSLDPRFLESVFVARDPIAPMPPIPPIRDSRTTVG